MNAECDVGVSQSDVRRRQPVQLLSDAARRNCRLALEHHPDAAHVADIEEKFEAKNKKT